MKAIDETITLTSEEERVLHDYLFSVEIWGLYELSFLFFLLSSIISPAFDKIYSRNVAEVRFLARSWEKSEYDAHLAPQWFYGLY